MQFRNYKEEILKIASQNKIFIRKSEGQCFLINQQVAEFIVLTAALDKDRDIVIEIGPGFGSLTQFIIQNAKYTIAIENDKKIAQYLEKKYSKQENLEIRLGDALKTPFPKHTKLISNVPYHISGPLIQKILLSEEKSDSILFMLQQEFINRMKATPQAKGYGRISVISQLFFFMQELRKVSRFDFYPQPDVESSIIQLKFNPEYIENPSIPAFIEFLAGLFPYKNKIVPKALSFLKKNIKNFPILNSLKEINVEEEIPLEMKNKRVWQLTPDEIWNLFIHLNIN